MGAMDGPEDDEDFINEHLEDGDNWDDLFSAKNGDPFSGFDPPMSGLDFGDDPDDDTPALEDADLGAGIGGTLAELKLEEVEEPKAGASVEAAELLSSSPSDPDKAKPGQ